MDLIEQANEFSDALSVPDWKMKRNNVCVLSFDGESFTHVALAKRGFRAASYKSNIKFKNIQAFEPLSIKLIGDLIDKKFVKYFKTISSGEGGRLTPKSWEKFKEALSSARPDILSKINSLENIINEGAIEFDSRTYEVLAQEKDALGLSLSIFGLDRSRILSDWALPEKDELPPFLQGIKAYRLSEDTIIINDTKIFGDWKTTNKKIPILAAAEFRKDDEKLIVLNTNRTSIEKTLGVDLIYYHYKYDAFVLVQYKVMRLEGEESRNYVYRPNNDKSYSAEIERMKNFESKYIIKSKMNNINGFRLHENPFFFKICKPIVLSPLSSGMCLAR